MKYTGRTVQKALLMIGSGDHSIAETARIIGAAYPTVYQWVQKAGLRIKRKRWNNPHKKNETPREIKEKACRMYLVGFTMEEVAEDIGVSVNSIHRWIKKARIKPRSRRLSVDEKEIIQLYESGVSSNEIAERIGTSRKPVMRVLWENNVQIRDKSAAQEVVEGRKKEERLVKFLLDECA